jgi:phage tail-like protein
MDPVYPSVGFYFQVMLDNQAYSFKEVSGISAEITTEEITEGGENRFKYKVPTGVKYNNLELKRGLVPKSSNLFVWINNALTLGLDKTIKTKALEISLLNEKGNKVMSWSFVNVWPVGWNNSSLNSMNNEILIESISLSYNYFTTKIISQP